MTDDDAIRDRHDIDLSTMEPTPGCTLTDAEADQRKAFFRSELLPHVRGFELLDDGFVLAVANTDEALAAVTTLVRYENRCCSFAAFDLSVPDDGGVVRLEMTGLEAPGEALGAGLVEQLEAIGEPA